MIVEPATSAAVQALDASLNEDLEALRRDGLFRPLRVLESAQSPEVEIGGKTPELVEVDDVSGSVTEAGTDGEMITPAANVVGFSCSSKRTISVTGRAPLSASDAPQAPAPKPSRQIL